MEVLSGSVERVVFQNPESGWCVLKIRVKGRRRLVSVVGHAFFVAPGETIEAEGEWTEHSEHGEHLLASSLKTTLPRTATAAQHYLGSGLVSGIGPEIAKRMVARFGAGVFEVIENNSDLLRGVPGVGPVRAEAISEAWKEQRALKGIMDFLGSHGISTLKAPRILKTLGPDARAQIEKNPYRLAREVAGLGFRSADVIARHLGVALDSEERFACALHDRLMRAVMRGHCAAPAAKIVREAAQEIGLPMASPEIAKIWSALETEIESGRVTEDPLDGTFNDAAGEFGIFPAALANAERRLARNLLELSQAALPWGSAVFLEAPQDPSKQNEITKLSVQQRAALACVLSSKVSVLTGGPGTGKTTLIRSAVNELARRGWTVLCCAPTGRAAQRLQEAAGVEAQTIHRLLGWDPETQGFRHRAEFPLRVDLLIVDESSMVGVELMDALVQALPKGAALLLVGDKDQLPSVQAGRVLESVIASGVFTHAHLDEIFRQANGQESLIVRAARDVLRGIQPELLTKTPGQEFHFIEARSAEACIERVVKLVGERIPDRFGLDPMSEVQVLAPMNKGLAGARELNRRLQLALNPDPRDRIDRFGLSLAVGDKVIVTMNDYDKEVFNGDVGRVTEISREDSSVRVAFAASRSVKFEFAELDSLALAYAISVHKAQGSEYEAVVIALQEESAALLGRNLLYTAITRGKKLVVVVGSREALRLALREQPRLDQRLSGLARRLRAYHADGVPPEVFMAL